MRALALRQAPGAEALGCFARCCRAPCTLRQSSPDASKRLGIPVDHQHEHERLDQPRIVPDGRNGRMGVIAPENAALRMSKPLPITK